MYKLINKGLLVAFTLSAAAALASGPATLEEALTLAGKENKVVVADFFTDW